MVRGLPTARLRGRTKNLMVSSAMKRAPTALACIDADDAERNCTTGEL